MIQKIVSLIWLSIFFTYGCKYNSKVVVGPLYMNRPLVKMEKELVTESQEVTTNNTRRGFEPELPSTPNSSKKH